MKLNFYINKHTQNKFIDYIIELGAKFLIMKKLKIYDSINPYDFADKYGFIEAYIHHELFGKLQIHTEDGVDEDGFMGFSAVDSPVISFCNSIIIPSTKEIRKGKIYTKTSYYKDRQLVQKPQELTVFYKKLEFWIEKNVPKRDIGMDLFKKNIYIDDDILSLFENNKIKLV